MPDFISFRCAQQDFDSRRHSFIEDDFRLAFTPSEPDLYWSSPEELGDVTIDRSLVGAQCVARKGVWKLTAPDVRVSAKSLKHEVTPIRYVVLYNTTKQRLIGYWDFGRNLYLRKSKGEIFHVQFTDREVLRLTEDRLIGTYEDYGAPSL